LYERTTVSGFGFGPVKYVLNARPEANAFLFANSGLFHLAGGVRRSSFRSTARPPSSSATAMTTAAPASSSNPAFHRRRIDGYVARMAPNATRSSIHGGLDRASTFMPWLRDLVRRSTVELLFGPRLPPMPMSSDGSLQYALNAITGLKHARLHALPARPAWRRVLNARAAVVERVMREIN